MNLLEVRKIIETGAAASAARKRTIRELKDDGRSIGRMKIAHGNEELGEKADLNFHLALGLCNTEFTFDLIY